MTTESPTVARIRDVATADARSGHHHLAPRACLVRKHPRLPTRPPVDVGELSSRNLVYANEAIHRGLRIYADNPDAADLYAATLLGLYVQFNQSRKEIIDAYTV